MAHLYGWIIRFTVAIPLSFIAAIGVTLVAPSATYAAILPRYSAATHMAGKAVLTPTDEEGNGGFKIAAQIQADNGEVEMCFISRGQGQEIEGTLPGFPPGSAWAGILHVTLNGVEQNAFCTDISNGVSLQKCFSNSTIGATNPLVACMLQYYPPDDGISKEEAAARQAAVWHFSDALEMTGPPLTKLVYDLYVADILAKQAAGQCDALSTPSLLLDPASAINFLVGDGNGGFLTSSHEYTVTVKTGATPVTNQQVTVTTSLGTLSSGGASGTTIVATTDANGQAKVTVSHNMTGTATIVANTTVTLPTGTRIDPAPTTQKIVVAGNTSFTLQASATKRWEATGKVVIQKFHDKDRNGIFNQPPDAPINWLVVYRQADGNDFTGEGWTPLVLGEDGTEAIDVQLGVPYQICEVTLPEWSPTRPICAANVTGDNVVAFGNVQLPVLLINKYHDLNANGTRDPGEVGLEGWQFSVDRLANNFWSASYSGQTDSDGRLGFSGVLYPFEYRVMETLATGWYSTTATLQSVAITTTGLYTLSFGNLMPGSLTVEKSWFSNNSPVASPEPAVVCVERIPAPPSHAPVPSANGTLLTVLDGKYCAQVEDRVTINELWPGNYVVTENSPAGWVSDSGSKEVTILSGENKTTAFRNDQLGALGDFVWIDQNKNGIQDAGEPGVPGVKVDLYREDGAFMTAQMAVENGTFLATQMTGEDGRYLFTELDAGAYYVEFAHVPGMSFTKYNVNGNSQDAVDSDPVVAVVELTASDGGLEAELGEPFTYTLHYTNTDLALPAENLVISTVIPPGTSFAPNGSGWVCEGGGTIVGAGTSCTFPIGTLPANSTGSIRFVITVGENEQEVPDQLNVAFVVEHTSVARTGIVTLGEREVNLTVDAGVVAIRAQLATATPTQTTGLPVTQQPQQERYLFLPLIPLEK